jgi:signal transduction histidine kinase
VATFVARKPSEAEVFHAIAREIGQLAGANVIRILRYGRDGHAVVVGSYGEPDAFPVGARVATSGDSATARVFATRHAARIDDYRTPVGPVADAGRAMGVRSVVGVPILVEGQVWGAVMAAQTAEIPLRPDTELRVGHFTELIAIAIANAEARAALDRLVEEKTALGRAAMLVAQGAPPESIFEAVGVEIERLLRADHVMFARYEPDSEATVLALRGSAADKLPPGMRVSHAGPSVMTLVRNTGRPGRWEDYDEAPGTIAKVAREVGVRSAAGAPILLEGRVWGVIAVSWDGVASPPAGIEERIARFAELLETAIVSADTRDQLAASRARLVTAADDARRRLARDLHDGAQSRLVHSVISLKLAQQVLRGSDGEATTLVDEALTHVEQANVALRELAHGIMPAVLAQRGLRAGIDSIVERLNLPVDVNVGDGRFDEDLETSAYFMVAEALTNVVKHAKASRAEVTARVEDSTLHVQVRDDGIGGADPNGHGLVGLRDRATALGGQLRVECPSNGGTVLSAALPLSHA